MTRADDFIQEYSHFLECIDFNHTYLDSKAITFLNTAPITIRQIENEALAKIDQGSDQPPEQQQCTEDTPECDSSNPPGA